MSLTFAVGERPITPLVVTLTNEDGSIINLSGIDLVALEGEGLPAGTTSVIDATAGRVAYTFTAPFTAAGIVLMRARLEEVDQVDFTGYIELEVTDPIEPDLPIVTPSNVEGTTGRSVSRQDVARAQGLIGMALGQNLGDAEWLAIQSIKDRYWLAQAVAFQSVYLRENPGDDDSAKYASVSTGDVSITYRDTNAGGPNGIGLAPLALMALSRLSWRRKRTLHPRPFSHNVPRTYTDENAFNWPVVRTDAPPYSYTWPLV